MATTTDIPCECGTYELEIETDFVGYMGDRPCYEDYGHCPNCGKKFWNNEISERFKMDQED